MQILGKELELNEKIYVPHVSPLPLARKAIESLTQNIYPFSVFSREEMDKLFESIGIEMSSATWKYLGEEYRGDFVSRLEGYTRFEHNSRIYTSDLRWLRQELANAQTDKIRGMYLELSTLIDWQPGDFYESRSSCWWSGYEDGKCQFMSHCHHHGKGFAAKVYDDQERNLGRFYAFITKDRSIEDEIVVFNIYTRPGISYLDLLMQLQGFFEQPYHRISLYPDAASHIYINGEQGYYFGKDKNINSYRPLIQEYYDDDDDIEYYRFREHDRRILCPNCGRHVRNGDVFMLLPQEVRVCFQCVREIAPRGVVNVPYHHPVHGVCYYDRGLYHWSKTKDKIVKTKVKEVENVEN